MESFVRDYGARINIPDPPKFISYTNPELSTSQQPMPRIAHFPRSSSQQLSNNQAMWNPPWELGPEGLGVAGYGAVGGGNVSRSNTRLSTHVLFCSCGWYAVHLVFHRTECKDHSGRINTSYLRAQQCERD